MKPNQEIVSLLLKTAKSHAQATGGNNRYQDPNWPNWFAEFLINKTDFLSHTERSWTSEDLAYALMDLDHSFHNNIQKVSWPVYFGQRLIS